MAQLTALRDSITARDGATYARYDSVRKEYKPPMMADRGPLPGEMDGPSRGMRRSSGAGMSGGARSGGGAPDALGMMALREQARALGEMSGALMGNHDADAKKALALLTADQQPKGQELLDDKTQELRKKLP